LVADRSFPNSAEAETRLSRVKGWAYEKPLTRRRPAAQNRIPMQVVVCSGPAGFLTPDVNKLYQESQNVTLLIETLRHASVSGHCPAWAAREAGRLLLSARTSSVMNRWSRRHHQDLVDLRRYWYVKEDRRYQLPWRMAAQ
jgi:hypothetical protein